METMDEEPGVVVESVDSFVTLTEQTRSRKVPWSKLAAGFYSLFLVWQLVGNVLYSIRVVECSVGEKLESFHCENITTFPSSKVMELTWYITRLLHMICIFLAVQKVPNFPGNVATLKKLKLLPAFWTLLILLLMSLIRYLVLLGWSKAVMTFLVTLCFILSCVLKFVILGITNYIQLNHITQRYPSFVLVLTKITFIVILLQSVNDFCLALLQLALSADDFNSLKLKNKSNFRILADLFRKSAECSFHYKTMDFFWQKLFNDNKNILGSNHVYLDHT